MKSGEGKGGVGVQVSVLLSALHTGVVRSMAPLVSWKVAMVNVVSIAALNVKTTGALAETPLAPLAGVTETIVGPAARAWLRKLIALPTASNPAIRKVRRKGGNRFISFLYCINGI
jgi:hypothetical protein